MPEKYFVAKGSHAAREDGMCAMEWVSYLAGELHSDQPKCVSHVLARFCIAFNDALDDVERQKLRPYLARTIGTRGDGRNDQRSWLAIDWLIRTHAPTWLALAGLGDVAARLRALSPVLSTEDLLSTEGLMCVMVNLDDAHRQAGCLVRSVPDRAAAVGVVVGDAIRDSGWGAAWGAAGSRWGLYDSYIWPTIATTIVETITDAARAAAWNIAVDTARRADRTPIGVALQPTVLELQRSAFDLLDRMLPTEVIQLPVAPDAALVTATEG